MIPADQAGGPARERSWGWRSAVGTVALFAIAIVIAAHVVGTEVYHLDRVTAAGEVFFPAAGVTVAALLLLPRRLWPVIFAAAFASQLAFGLVAREAVVTSVGSAVASTVEPAVGAVVLLAWLGGPPALSRRRHLLAFVAGPAVLGAGAGALIGAIASSFTQPGGQFVTVLARWWVSDALGVLIVGGLLLAWLTETGSPIQPRYRRLEAGALVVSAGLLAWLAFWNWRPGLTYLCLLPLGWAAIRFGARGATAVATLIAVAGEWGTITDHGLFATLASHDNIRALWLLQLFLGIAVLGGLVLANQVAELSRAEAALRDSERAEREARLAAREAKAAERTRLARDLHDSVSQALFAMTMHVRTAELALAQAPESADRPLSRAISHLRELTSLALAEMRALIFELRPDALAQEGLVAALSRQAAAISAREQLPITVNGPAEPLPLSAEAAENSYRVALEALHNAVKHAAGSHAAVTVTVAEQDVRIRVTDDGTGFDASQDHPGHLGLKTMTERASAAGGDLKLISAPGAGTLVQLTVPAHRIAAGGNRR